MALKPTGQPCGLSVGLARALGVREAISMRFTVLVLLLACAPQSYAGVYKCTINGQTTYSDTPCPDAAQRESGRMDNKPQLTIGVQNGAGSPVSTQVTTSTESATPQAGPVPIDVQEKINKAAATVSVTRLKARDCEWAIKVDHQFQKCTSLSKLLNSGEYNRAVKESARLLEKYPSLNDDPNMRQVISQMLREAQEVQSVLNLAEAYVKAN